MTTRSIVLAIVQHRRSRKERQSAYDARAHKAACRPRLPRIYDSAAISEQDLDVYAAAYRAPGAMRSAFEMYRALEEDAEFNRAAISAGKLSMPVVAVGAAGRLSSEYLAKMGDEIAERSSVHMVDRCGHWVSEEQPDALAEAILSLGNEVLSPNQQQI